MNLLAYFRTVLWSFLGIRRRASADADMGKVKPLGLLGVAALLLAVFGFTLYGLASFAVSTLK
jgi:hypothetical protein